MKVTTVSSLLIACLLAGFFSSCSFTEKEDIQSIYGYAMGTSYSIKLVAGLNESRTLQIGIEGVLSDINQRMSTYLQSSDLSLFAQADINSYVDVDPKTVEVVSSALAISKLTDGAFDPTIAPLVDLWGFGPTERGSQLPDSESILELLPTVDFTAVQVDVEKSRLFKTEDVQLDLSAIAKGYAVDSVADYLDANGIENYLVEVGGEMAFSGKKPGNVSWRIAVEKPVVNDRVPFRVLEMAQGSVATSGDYRNYFEVDGVRYSHTLNPDTGYPIDHDVASVTVVMDSCMEADAFATAFNVMGRVKTLELAKALDIAVFIIYKQDEQFLTAQSPKFSAIFGEISQ